MLNRKNLIVKILGAVIIITAGWIVMSRLPKSDEGNIVNVYCFYGMIPHTVLKQFEQETGIKVRFDVYDNNEILEAKLLATNSGYDVVMPTSPPYIGRQIAIGIYQSLKAELLPNLGPLDPTIVEKMQMVDPGLIYTVPYFWGTVGIAFDYDRVSALLPGVDLNSHALLFDPENLKRLAPHGISFFEEAIDVFPAILHYLGKNSNSDDLQDLEIARKHLEKLRPYIRRFTSSRFINDLIMGDVCLTQAWSGEAQQAVQEAKEVGRDIRFVTPKEGAGMFIDCLAIPKGARHPRNAHAFINFLIRPDIAAQVTNNTFIPTAILKSIPLVDDEIRNNKSIYPPLEVMKTLELYQLPQSEKSSAYERERNRLWAKIRLAR